MAGNNACTYDYIEPLRFLIAKLLTRYIVQCKEEEIMRGLIHQYFPRIAKKEGESVMFYARQLANGDSCEYDQDKKWQYPRVFTSVADYLKEKNSLLFDGFLRFRLKEYKESLKQLVEHAVEEYLMEKEYQEFIGLLQYFVSIQVPKTTTIHVIHIDDRNFQWHDDHFQLFSQDDLHRFFSDLTGESINYEDLVITTLISLAPAKVILHTRQPTNQIIYTIKSIFKGKIELCEDCPHCAKHLEKKDLSR
jgi:putative sporulation protein YtxC